MTAFRNKLEFFYERMFRADVGNGSAPRRYPKKRRPERTPPSAQRSPGGSTYNRSVNAPQAHATKEAVMDKELFDFVAERADILSKSDFSTQVTKDAAQAWKDAVAADAEAADAATETLLNALEGRPTTIDGVIGFLEGPAKGMLGEQAADQGLASQRARKKAGANWCDGEACAAATQILAKFGRIEL